MRIKRGVHANLPAQLGWRVTSNVPQIALIVGALLSILVVAFVALRATYASPPCPCNVFTASQPSTAPGLFTQPGGIEVGFKFQAEQNGYISGIRFYKVAGMAGVHTASLWDTNRGRIAQANFTAETATGWQQVDISPVAVVANTIYTVSVFMTDGNYTATSSYFTSNSVNSPLIAPKDGDAYDALGNGKQGTYNASGSSLYPTDSFGSGNYWVDVSYVTSLSTAPPVVTAKTPTSNATNTPLTDTVTATLNRSLDPSTVNSSTVMVKDAQDNIVSGVVSYNTTTYTIKFLPTSIWQTNMTYTVTLKGGTGAAVADMQGYKLAVDYGWSFTTTATALQCPCSLKNNQAPNGSTTYRDTSSTSGLETGLKIIPKANGYITALRFYKPIITPDTVHIGNIWSASGVKLATASFTNESDYGWQEVQLSTPLSVTKDQLYIISYGMTTAYYQALTGVFTQPMVSPGFVAYPSGDTRNTAAGSGTLNSVFSTTAGTYPLSGSPSNGDYFVDAVFAIGSTETTPLGVTGVQPSDTSYGIARTTTMSATFDQRLNGATINGTTVTVKDSNNVVVSSAVAYDNTKRAVTITPTNPLAYNMTYTVTLDGQIQDSRGVSMGANYVWSFITESPSASDMNQGNGGPILVVTTTANPYSAYYAEILRTEGLNYFDVKDSSLLSATTLAQYTTVVLAEMTVTQAQVDVLSTWVNGGGNLVAMRPDKKFVNLLGLTDANSTATNQYLRTNTASPAGIGIVDDTIQFKGTADAYSTNGADVVASLYSNATTITAYPAATTRAVGSGTAMAFTYDLAKSVIGLHQGNKAWAGQNRDGDTVVRTNDLFYGPKVGDIQPDWLDINKMHIPQADEQQRLLVNMITNAMKKRLPAPRFWYLPNDQKTALVLAGDDHNLLNKFGTEQTINNWLNESVTGCSVVDWQCVRASHYVYSGGELTNARASQYSTYGFDVADHLSGNGDCATYTTYTELNTRVGTDLANWRLKYVSLPNQQTSRSHCYAWSDWDSVPRADNAHGIRYDLTTVAYPAAWVGTRSPIVTGSGMNMRLTDTSGALIDVRQGVTNFDDTAAGVTSIAAAFDNAIGSSGYYGIFGSHYDMTNSYSDTLLSLAKSRNVPIISADQALKWLDGRNSSNFSNLASSQQGKESFTITTAKGANGLQAMVPLSDGAGTLTKLTRANQIITYRTDIIKGVSYAMFSALPGDYEVLYSDFGTNSLAGNTPPTGMTGVAQKLPRGEGSGGDATTPETAVSQDTAPATQQPARSASDKPTTTSEAVGIAYGTLIVLLSIGAVLVAAGGVSFWLLVIRPRL